MGDDMNKATKGHYYDPKGSSGSPELLSYRAYEHTHDGQLRLHEHGELKASAKFNGIFDLNTNNFSPSIGGKAGSKEEEVFHETLNAAREKIKQDVSIIQKINDKAASKLALGMPSILRINPFKNN